MTTARMGTGSRPATGLQVRLLGELEVRRGDGPPLELPPSRRTRALLGYLLATGAPHSRSSLCDLLWDGSDDPRAALRWSLTKLRPVVDDDTQPRLQADRDKVVLSDRGCRIDTRHVAALLPAQDPSGLPLATLEEAARALRGEFLDGLELPSCYRFHHWWMGERERHARMRSRVLQALIEHLAGEPERALPWGRAMVASDPLAEAAHATLVRLLAASGRYPEAEAHHAYARELLRRELALPDGGVLDETIRAARRRQRLAATQPRMADSPAQAMPPVPPEAAPRLDGEPAVPATIAELVRSPLPAPLVGREAECAAIDAALVSPAAAPVLLFLGEPGIGKTRLLDHAAEQARTRGFGLIRSSCFEAESVRPYGPWIDALRGVDTQGVDAAVLAAAAPLMGGPVLADGAFASIGRDALFEASVQLLDRLAARQPQLLLIDDLQWIDEASAALLHYVVRRLGGTPHPIVIVAAARSGEVDDNAGAKALLQSLARIRTLQQFEPAPLGEPQVRQWLGDRLRDVEAALRDSGGNPLYLVELARERRNAPASTRQALESLIGNRLRALDDATRDLLGWAATLGEAFAVERLADATGRPLADVLPRVALLERRGLLRGSPQGQLDFAHGLVRQAVYRSLSMARRRAQHRHIARTLVAASAEDPWLHGAIVHHASLAGDAPVAARSALAAGEHWLRVFAYRDAAQVAERGLALLDGLPRGAERSHLEVGLLRLRVAAAAAAPGGRALPELRERIHQAVDAAQSLGLHGIASSGWEILAYWCQQRGDAPGAQAATLAAERCARLADELTRCQQLANTGRCLIDIEANTERGRRLLDDAAALANELQLPLMELEWGRGLAARADGQLQTARALLERAVALAQAAANHWREYECRLALATVEFELGHDADVLVQVEAVAEAARRMGELQVPFANALAALARQRLGEPGADAAVQAALAALRERDAKAHLAYALNVAAARSLKRGAGDVAERLAIEALAAAEAVRRPSLVARARATLAAAAPAAKVPS